MNRRHAFGAIAATAVGLTLAACSTMSAPTPDIVDTLSANAQFSTLVAGLTSSGALTTLQGPGPYTVFAPGNNAFAALPKGTLERLLKPENQQELAYVLTYHVIPGTATSATLAGKANDVVALNGRALRIDGTRGGVHVNDALVTQGDIVVSNGVIHVIDRVLLPPKQAN